MASFVDDLISIAQENFCQNWGAMYGSLLNVSLGAGVIVRGLRHAVFDESTSRFTAKVGAALVLTHECDIEQTNTREFNQHFVGIPLIFTKDFANIYAARPQNGRDIIRSAANGSMSRLYFLPPPPVDFPEMEFGAIVYMNLISAFHLDQIEDQKKAKVCALSSHGLFFVDKMLEQHLLRPKSDKLSSYGPVYRPTTITSGRFFDTKTYSNRVVAPSSFAEPAKQTDEPLRKNQTRELAYRFWDQCGRPEGRSIEFWHLAEIAIAHG